MLGKIFLRIFLFLAALFGMLLIIGVEAMISALQVVQEQVSSEKSINMLELSINGERTSFEFLGSHSSIEKRIAALQDL